MSDRITVKDVRRAANAHAECLDRCGIALRPGHRITLAEGSAADGRAYRIHSEDENGGLWQPPIGGDYLGMTAREAYEALVARTGVIYDTCAALEDAKASA